MLLHAALILCLTIQTPPASARININTASAAELQRLPSIGPALAARIIEYRRKHGPFKRAQDLIIVRGFSAGRFRRIAHLITA